MANELTAFSPEYWSKRMQIIRFKEPVFRALASYEERAMLKNGDTVHRPYRSRMNVQSYTKGTAVTVQDVTATDEYLSVDTTKVVPFYVDDLDDLQNKWPTVNQFADDAGKELFNFIDADFLSEVVNSTSSIDDGDVGGTTGTSIDLTVSNIAKMFASAGKKLDRQNVDRKSRFAVISPTVHQLLLEKMDGKDTQLGDSIGMNGQIGKYMGFELFLSNALYWTGRWTPANQPTDADTITIAGVVYHLVTTIGAVAGNVLVETNTATTLDNLVDAINNPTVTSAKHVAISAADQKILEGITAVDGTTYLGITWKGGSEAVVSASEANDPWSLQTVYGLFGEKGAIDLVIQQEPKVVFKEVQDKLGKNVIPWTLYGKKTFTEGAKALVKVSIDSSTLV
jgi:hypothetical protein